jgi:hypothetical protein
MSRLDFEFVETVLVYDELAFNAVELFILGGLTFKDGLEALIDRVEAGVDGREFFVGADTVRGNGIEPTVDCGKFFVNRIELAIEEFF